MIFYKTEVEIDKIRKSSLLVGKTLAEVAKCIRPGIKTIELDRLAEEFIRDNKAVPAFKGYRGFPATLCVSINDQVVHGIPGNIELKDGDIVSVDCGVLKDEYYGDSAYTFEVGEVKPEVVMLLKATKESLYKGIATAHSGKRLGDIGYEIQNHVESLGYSVVRDLVGHGVGRELHEKPEVANFGKRGSGMKLKEGLVIAIEPMINLGKYNVIQESDGWTIRTSDRLPSAHFEHTLVVRKNNAEILSSFTEIEEIISKQYS